MGIAEYVYLGLAMKPEVGDLVKNPQGRIYLVIPNEFFKRERSFATGYFALQGSDLFICWSSMTSGYWQLLKAGDTQWRDYYAAG